MPGMTASRGGLLALIVIAVNVVILGGLLIDRSEDSQPDVAQVRARAAKAGLILSLDAKTAAILVAADPATPEWAVKVQEMLMLDKRRQLSVHIFRPAGASASPIETNDPRVNEYTVPRGVKLSDTGIAGSWDSWSLYDRTGLRRFSGSLLGGGLLGSIAQVLEDSPELAVELNDMMAAAVSDDQFRERFDLGARHGGAGSQAILFIRSAFTTCPTNEILTEMQRIAATRGRTGHNLSVAVPAEWTEEDIASLIGTYGLTVPVRRVDSATDAHWKRLASLYGSSQSGAFVARVENGRLSSVYTDSAPVLQFLYDIAVELR